jgi:hypothetical protein
MIRQGDIENRKVRMLELQPFLSRLKRTIPDRQQLLLIEQQVPLVIDRPLVFRGHRSLMRILS